MGHIISEDGVATDPDKTKAVREMPKPRTKKELKSALGLFSYFRKYIRDFSRVAAPLHKQIKIPAPEDGQTVTEANRKNFMRNKLVWDKEMETSWAAIIDALTSPPVLTHPDWNSTFEVHADACKHGLGCVLIQKQSDGKDKVIMFASKSLTDVESRYATWELEAYACVWGVGVFRQYLLPPFGRKFKIFTDSTAVTFALNPQRKDRSARLAHWMVQMSEYEYEILHRTGSSNVVADHLSRNPLPCA